MCTYNNPGILGLKQIFLIITEGENFEKKFFYYNPGQDRMPIMPNSALWKFGVSKFTMLCGISLEYAHTVFIQVKLEEIRKTSSFILVFQGTYLFLFIRFIVHDISRMNRVLNLSEYVKRQSNLLIDTSRK